MMLLKSVPLAFYEEIFPLPLSLLLYVLHYCHVKWLFYSTSAIGLNAQTHRPYGSTNIRPVLSARSRHKVQGMIECGEGMVGVQWWENAPGRLVRAAPLARIYGHEGKRRRYRRLINENYPQDTPSNTFGPAVPSGVGSPLALQRGVPGSNTN